MLIQLISNKISYILRIRLLLAIISVSSCSPEFRAINTSVLKEADTLSKTGILKDKNGYIYLKLEDQYIHKLYPIIQRFDYKAKKPPYFRTLESIGAHVSVIYEAEAENLKIKEINKSFNFIINKLKLVESKGISYYVLEIESPELEKFRLEYDLTKFLKGFKFHITLAIKEGTK